jgi:GxxExxY protein
VTEEELNIISGGAVDSAMRVHSAFGPGLLESAYEACLVAELEARGFHVERQVILPIVYRTVTPTLAVLCMPLRFCVLCVEQFWV